MACCSFTPVCCRRGRSSKRSSLADEVHRSLAADDDNAFLRQMYGDEPRRWSDDLTGNDRLRCVVNALTRLRVVSSDGAMNLKHKGQGEQSAARRHAVV